jgi:hypothetical protein
MTSLGIVSLQNHWIAVSNYGKSESLIYPFLNRIPD